MKERLLIYLVIALAVPIGGEMKFYPFEGDMRVSLGTPVFFFILLWSRKLNPLLAGLVSGSSVVAFRSALYMLVEDPSLHGQIFLLHFPVFFYYLTFALFFYFFKIYRLYSTPFLVGLLGVMIEIISSMAEIFVRSFFSNIPITANTFITIGIIAIIRSFFVLGFFNIFVIREARLAEEQQRKRNEQILLLISNLYVEMIQLKKTMKNAETVTADCYGFYRTLKSLDYNDFAKNALQIAGEMHEIKKDNQRIYAGLSKLMDKENLSDFMDISEIVNVVVTCNTRYSSSLGKSVELRSDISGTHPPYHTFMLLSVINNLVSNAVESIVDTGVIMLKVCRNEDRIIIQIEDNGPGIGGRNRPLIFEPGFTTKFDFAGAASNGIGLSHVKNVIDHLDGSIELEQENNNQEFGTIFTIKLPVTSLSEKRG
ncbi:sensor histidine kinase [Mesobacillus subterraneus]|uniref:histidine kinase n=1 Tax=Mesobacillus subterraneus TaxID=285983 RepID=A0A3R9KRQ7_9BACI|nr:sensor histidine kinase [Mesobacillus subterraneus]RSD24032.1 sensor histidine kinase [Mesobacillus subterraneus]